MPGDPKKPASKKPESEVSLTVVVTVTFAPEVQELSLLETPTGSVESDGAAARVAPDTFRLASL